MSRDALVATTVALLFAASIGGALWYRGISLPITQLASMDNVLASSGAVPEPASQAGMPEATAPPVNAPTPNNAQPPLLPPAPPEIAEEKKEEPKPASEKPAGKTVSKLPTTPAKKPVEKLSPPKGELSMPALPEGDLVNDVALPPVLDSSRPAAPTKPSLPASEPNMPVNVPEQVTVPAPPAPPTKTTPKNELLPNLDGDKPVVAESPVPPAPPSVTAKSDAVLPSVDELAMPKLEAELNEATKKTSPPAESSLAEEPLQNKKSSLPKSSLPDSEEMTGSMPGEKPASLTPAGPVESKRSPAMPAASAMADSASEEPVRTMPSPKLPTNDLKPVATATPTKTSAVPTPAVSATGTGESAPASNLPKIPAPPSERVTAKAIQPPSTNGATLGTPAVPPAKGIASSSAPAPTPKDVIATAQPIKATPSNEPIDPAAAPIAQAKSLRGSAAPPDQAATVETAAKPDEYLPLSNNHREYVPLGPGRPSEEFVSVAGGALPKGEVAYGGTAVVNHVQVRKTDLTSDQPKVISYDAKAYLTLEGDSFERIAETMYHTSGYGEALARYNRSRFRGDDVLPTGAKVRVPPMEVLGQQRGMASTGTARDAFQKVDRMPYVMSNAPAGAGAAIPVSNHPPIQRSAFDHQLVGTPAPEPPGNHYHAERNETLWAIAKKHLGDGRRWREIYNLNRDRLVSETQVPAGTTLRMPTTTP